MSAEIIGGTYAICAVVTHENNSSLVLNPLPISAGFNFQQETYKYSPNNFTTLPVSFQNAITIYVAQLNGEHVNPAGGLWGLAMCWGPCNNRYMIVVECVATRRAVARVEKPEWFLPKPTKIVNFQLNPSGTISNLSELPVVQGFKNQGGEMLTFTKLHNSIQSGISKVIREINGNERDWTKQPWGLAAIYRGARANVYYLTLEWQHAGLESLAQVDARSGPDRRIAPPAYTPSVHDNEPTQ